MLHSFRVSISIWMYSSLTLFLSLWIVIIVWKEDFFILPFLSFFAFAILIPIHFICIHFLKMFQYKWDTQIWLMTLFGWIVPSFIFMNLESFHVMETKMLLYMLIFLFSVGGSNALGNYIACRRNPYPLQSPNPDFIPSPLYGEKEPNI